MTINNVGASDFGAVVWYNSNMGRLRREYDRQVQQRDIDWFFNELRSKYLGRFFDSGSDIQLNVGIWWEYSKVTAWNKGRGGVFGFSVLDLFYDDNQHRRGLDMIDDIGEDWYAV